MGRADDHLSRAATVDGMDVWLVDKDAEGVIKPPPRVVYDRPGYGIALVDERGRDFVLTGTGGQLDAWCGQAVRLTPATARDLAAALARFADHAEQTRHSRWLRAPSEGPPGVSAAPGA